MEWDGNGRGNWTDRKQRIDPVQNDGLGPPFYSTPNSDILYKIFAVSTASIRKRENRVLRIANLSSCTALWIPSEFMCVKVYKKFKVKAACVTNYVNQRRVAGC